MFRALDETGDPHHGETHRIPQIPPSADIFVISCQAKPYLRSHGQSERPSERENVGEKVTLFASLPFANCGFSLPASLLFPSLLPHRSHNATPSFPPSLPPCLRSLPAGLFAVVMAAPRTPPPPPPLIGKAGCYTIFITPPTTPTPSELPRSPIASPAPSLRANNPDKDAPLPAKAPSPLLPPPPVQVPPLRFEKPVSTSSGSVFGFFWDAVAEVQDGILLNYLTSVV